jgi:hypothetical protein
VNLGTSRANLASGFSYFALLYSFLLNPSPSFIDIVVITPYQGAGNGEGGEGGRLGGAGSKGWWRAYSGEARLYPAVGP